MALSGIAIKSQENCISFARHSPPQFLKPRRVGRGVAHGVLDVAVPEIVLDEPGVGSLVGQGIAAGMPQHVGVRLDGQSGRLAVAPDQGPDGFPAQGGAQCREEKRIAGGAHAVALDQPRLDGADFISAQGVGGGESALEPGDVQHPAFQIHLAKFQPAGFGHAQAMAEHHQEQAAVTQRVGCPFGGQHQTLDLASGQVFAVVHGSARAQDRKVGCRWFTVLSRLWSWENARFPLGAHIQST